MTSTSPSSLPPLLRLPTEVRLEIYSLLLCTQPTPTLSIRTIPAAVYTSQHDPRAPKRRTTYRYITNRLRSRSAESTYHLLPAPQPHSFPTIHTAILATSKQLHAEAAHVLYARHTFDFGLDVESIVPFLTDLTPPARRSLRSLALAKRALPYTKDFDRSEWRCACAAIAAHLSHSLASLHLTVYGGVPATNLFSAPDGSAVAAAAEVDLRPFSRQEVALMVARRGEEMEWAGQLAGLRGVREVVVEARMEHCPPPCSGAMVFFVAFSRSIEGGLAEWLKGVMVGGGEGRRDGGGWSFDAVL